MFKQLTATITGNTARRPSYIYSSSAHSKNGNRATQSTKWLKNVLYTVKPENAYRHAATTHQQRVLA